MVDPIVSCQSGQKGSTKIDVCKMDMCFGQTKRVPNHIGYIDIAIINSHFYYTHTYINKVPIFKANREKHIE